MSTISFGKALGKLIRQRRKSAGLTQMQLAEDALGSFSKTRRISEIETGSVDNPHAKTIDPIIAYLKISDEELDECAKNSVYSPDPELTQAYKEARKMIDALAYAFEHNEPNATLLELDQFLRTKAREWLELKTRIANIDAETAETPHHVSLALKQLAEGDFEKADQYLMTAEEEYQNKKTLEVIRKQISIRIMRADAKLLNENVNEAAFLYKSAAEYLRPFNEREMADLLGDLAHRVYENSRRSLRPTFLVAAEILELQISLPTVLRDPEIEKESEYRLGLIYRNAYRSRKTSSGQAMLDKAVFYSAKSAEHLSDDITRQVAKKLSWANCLMDRGQANNEITDLKHAISIFEVLRTIKSEEAIALRPHISNSIGVALISCIEIEKQHNNEKHIRNIEMAFIDAIASSEQTGNVETWSIAKLNLGNTQIKRSIIQENEEEQNHFLRIQGIANILSAIECYPEAAFPFQLAQANQILAWGFCMHAERIEDEICEIYLHRAISSLELASSIYEISSKREYLANVKFEIARIIYVHSIRFENNAKEDLSMAINVLAEATKIYSELNDARNSEKCDKFMKVLMENIQVVR